MEHVSIFMRIGWALWFIVDIISLFLLHTGQPRAEYVKQASLLYGHTIAQTIASVVFIILLTPNIAPMVVTANTKWLFIAVPYICFLWQATRIRKIAKYTVTRK